MWRDWPVGKNSLGRTLRCNNFAGKLSSFVGSTLAVEHHSKHGSRRLIGRTLKRMQLIRISFASCSIYIEALIFPDGIRAKRHGHYRTRLKMNHKLRKHAAVIWAQVSTTIARQNLRPHSRPMTNRSCFCGLKPAAKRWRRVRGESVRCR